MYADFSLAIYVADSSNIARERILPAVVSPVVVAWDNPFPVFNPKKKDGKKRQSSLDKGMSEMGVSDHVDAQPRTSQFHRRIDEPRPHTSQGYRRPELQKLSMDMRNAAMSGQRNFSNGQAPVRPPLHPLGSDRPVTSFQGESAPRSQQPQRSMTMPDDVTIGITNKKLQKNQPPQSNRRPLNNRAGPPEPYNYVPAPIKLVHVPPVYQSTRAVATSRIDADRNALISPEMPNFDAISPSANEKTDDPLHMRTDNGRPAYPKAAYQAPVNGAALSTSQSQPEPQNVQANQPSFAGFAFDLPLDSNNDLQMDQQEFQAGYEKTSPQPYNDRSAVGAPRNPSRSQFRAEQHPLRSTSGEGYEQPRSVSNVGRYGGLAIPQSQYRSASDVQRYPPRSQSGATNRGPAYDYDQDEYSGGSGPQQGRPGEPPGRCNQRPLDESQSSNKDQRQYSASINARRDLSSDLQRQRSQPPHSAQPPSSRRYQGEYTSAPLNPDMLPAHPVPVRPGLLQDVSAAAAATTERSRILPQQPLVNSTLTSLVSQEEKESQITTYDLNLLLQAIKSNPNDQKTMLTLAKKLVEAASVLSSEGGKADAKTMQKNRERYIFDAHKYLKKLVHQGYPDAMFYLAECHGQGSLGLQVDPKEAFHLYTSAAKAGHAQAAYRVAVCCEMGNEEGGGTRRDPLKAMHWYKRAASMGDTPAMYKFGIILLKGLLGQSMNPREAVSWLKRAAAQSDKDNPHALHELGLLYETASPSDAIIKDENYSRQLFTQAAELGYKFSQFRLGSAYEYGMLGCPIDPRLSIAWYTRAAAQAEHQSELALSGWYLTGSDGILQQSDTEAYLWARKAATSRLAKAEYAMGYFTEVGIGCAANLDEAKKWYWRAACECSLEPPGAFPSDQDF